MKIKFQIDYRTQWGQTIYVSGSGDELGDLDLQKAVPMVAAAGDQWELEVDFNKKEVDLTYRYFLRDENNGNVLNEFGASRHLYGLDKALDYVRLRDFWRSETHIDNSLYTSPFEKAFFKRRVKKQETPSSSGMMRLQLRAPRIGQDYVFGVVGSSGVLGSWDENEVTLMSDEDFPIWKVNVPMPSPEVPFEYKYVIYSLKQKKVVTWENRPNRYFPAFEITKKKSVVVTDEYFQYPVGQWKSAGVAIPVFSLRSESGVGVGEFTDINPLTDWAKKVGMKILQILPVNDTVATHSWVDSYPYAAISVNALHPLYANMKAIGALKDKIKQKEIDRLGKALNALEEVDYEKVMQLKSTFFQASFEEKGGNVLKSKAFKIFFEENRDWLVPYAVFSFLRDKYQTPDFKQWEEYTTIDWHQLESLTDTKAANYLDIAIHYYIQFFLDKQLKEASAYARKNGVVLKGDIPIGIYRNSVDAWMDPELFNMDCQAGAPPDDFSVSGQNWGFPTYNWEKMAEDDFKWWKDRLLKMSEYFDVFRIDHILGFFRIWEVAWDHVEGVMGRFNPALPVHVQEFSRWGLTFDWGRFCTPYIRTHIVYEIFGNHAHLAFDEYLDEYAQDCYKLKEHLNTQRKVKEHFDQLIAANPESKDFNSWVMSSLYRLLSEVLFLESPLSEGLGWNPRIAFHSTYSYQELDDAVKQKLDALYIHFFYRRHNDFWGESAMRKLPALKEATNMLICGEDLGMVPASVPGVMDALSILALSIQRMPNDDREFIHPADNNYLSVCSTGSHDMSTLREWWQEDRNKTQRFYNSILRQDGGAPYYCEPWIAKDAINQHMHSPSMLAIFPIQDLLAMDGKLRRAAPEEERINVPAINQHYWRYRMHLSVETLIEQEDFNSLLRQLIDQGGRSADY